MKVTLIDVSPDGTLLTFLHRNMATVVGSAIGSYEPAEQTLIRASQGRTFTRETLENHAGSFKDVPQAEICQMILPIIRPGIEVEQLLAS